MGLQTLSVYFYWKKKLFPNLKKTSYNIFFWNFIFLMFWKDIAQNVTQSFYLSAREIRFPGWGSLWCHWKIRITTWDFTQPSLILNPTLNCFPTIGSLLCLMEKSALPRESVAPTSCIPLKFDVASIENAVFPFLWLNVSCGLKPLESPIFVKDNEELGLKFNDGYGLSLKNWACAVAIHVIKQQTRRRFVWKKVYIYRIIFGMLQRER